MQPTADAGHTFAGSFTAETGLQYCNKIFDIETELADKSAEERYTTRLKLAKQVLEAFWAWLDSLHVLPKSKLGDAVTYAINQKSYLQNYLLDGRLEISNNRAENAIRPFTLGRKNWLFAITPRGASSSAAIYSLVESAKANGLDVYKYFNYILTLMPGMAKLETEDKNYRPADCRSFFMRQGSMLLGAYFLFVCNDFFPELKIRHKKFTNYRL